MNIHPVRGDIAHILKDPPPILAHIHNGAHKLAGNINIAVRKRLLAVVNQGRIRVIGGIVDLHHGAVGHVDLVDHRGHGGNQIQVVLSLQALLNDLQMQEAQKATAKAKAQGAGRLRLIA